MIPLRGVGIYIIAVLSVICPYTFVNNIYILFCNMLFSFWYKSTTEGKKVYHKQKNHSDYSYWKQLSIMYHFSIYYC